METYYENLKLWLADMPKCQATAGNCDICIFKQFKGMGCANILCLKEIARLLNKPICCDKCGKELTNVA